MRFTVAVLPGDGVGPEVAAEGVRVLKRVGERLGVCKRCDAVYLGAVGAPGGTTRWLKCGRRMAFSGCARDWDSLLICDR